MQFWRINENKKIINIGDTPLVGWDINKEHFTIPDEYLKNENFLLFRTCHGFGDWSIISAMPRILKKKYPNCKIYLPSPKLIKELYSDRLNQWSSWKTPEWNVRYVFDNNPYIDGYVDNIDGEVYHDHYRLYNSKNWNIPLVKQLLYFWGFTEEELKDEDLSPTIFWTSGEAAVGKRIINKHFDGNFNSLHLSHRYVNNAENISKIKKLLKANNNFPYIYQVPFDIKTSPFNDCSDFRFENSVTDIRTQLYIRACANINIGYQSGVLDSICGYSKVYMIPFQKDFRVGNYQEKIIYI